MSAPPRASRVLIVDDSPVLLAQLAERFKFAGFEAETAEGAREAVRRARHAVPPYDLYIADVRMPELSGYELVRALRRERQGEHAPIIIYSSLGGPIDIVEGLDAGADEHLAKGTIDADELVARANNLLALRREHSRRSAGQTGRALQEQPLISLGAGTREALGPLVMKMLVSRDEVRLVDSSEGQPDSPSSPADGDGGTERALQRTGASRLRLIRFGRLDHGANLADVIAVDDTPSPERRRVAFDAGVEDYIGAFLSPAESVARILNVVRRNRRWAAVSARPRHLLVEAMTDLDTGLYNRSYLLEHLRIALGRTQRYMETLALVLLEVTPVASAAGEDKLRTERVFARSCAVKLKESTRTTDLLCRLGPTTYAALLPRTSQSDALVVAERIVEAIRLLGSGADCAVGLAFAPKDGADSLEVIAQAEGVLATALRTGPVSGVVSTLGKRSPESPEQVGVDELEGRLAWVASMIEQLLKPGLSSPLNGIGAAAQVLERRTSGPDPRAPLIREVTTRVDELRAVLADAQRRLKRGSSGPGEDS